MLATAGGLVFTGGTNDRKIHAFDAATGKLLWESVTNSGIVAPPTHVHVDGKQYLAVLSGWGGDVRGMNGAIGRMFPGKVPEPPDGGGHLGVRVAVNLFRRARARAGRTLMSRNLIAAVFGTIGLVLSRFLSWHITLKLRSSTPPSR